MSIDEIIRIYKAGYSKPGCFWKAERALCNLADWADESQPDANPRWTANLLPDAKTLSQNTPAARQRHAAIEQRFRQMAAVANSIAQ